MGAGTAKYWAFISYSHRDARVAAAVQRALETYRIPRRLVGTRTAVGEVPAQFKPVFRDRDEMQAGNDLKATVREALEQSRYLIVVCSPDAARSPWVDQEIREFKRQHGESRVLALIASGEPFASRTPGSEAEECFPEALRFSPASPDGAPVEAPDPVAADLRPQGDGKRLAILRLVAGMIGVGVDDLVRRDTQRRVRRMLVIATASFVGMAIMTVLTLMAVYSRNEAQYQRAQAEDLIEYMLGDLRKKLDPVGRLDVLDSLGERALGYYAAQDAARHDAGSLGRRSRAQHLIGEIREQRGKLDEALTAFQSAAATTAELLARAPDDGQRIFDHAQSVYWVGYIAWRRGQAQPAEESFLKYRELAQRLVTLDPTNLDWQLEAAYASQNLGVAQLDRWRLADALQSFADTKNALSRLVGVRPALAIDLADAHGWTAKALEATGDYAGAAAAQRQRLEVLRAMTDADRDRQVQQQVANARYELGRLLLSMGDAAGAEPNAIAAMEQADALIGADPANMFWLSESCFIRLSLAEIEFALGKREFAHAEIARAMPQIRKLITSDASATNWQINLQGRGLALQARFALADDRNFPPSDLESYLETIGRFESRGERLKADQTPVVAAVEFVLGQLLDRSGQRDAAATHWRAVAARLSPLAEREYHPVLTLLARTQLQLGEVAVARDMAARIGASHYRHPAYADLVHELASVAGPAQVNVKRGRN